MMISLKYSMMINFREKVGKKKRDDSHTHMRLKLLIKGEERKSR